MDRRTRWYATLTATLLFGCGDFEEYYSRRDAGGADATAEGGTADGGGGKNRRLLDSSRGSAIDISSDDSRVVSVNRDAGSVTVFSVTYSGDGPVVSKVAEVPVCDEPWQVVIHPDGTRAFVVCRKDQKVVPVVDLTGTPKKGVPVDVGSEPTGIALTPRGTTAWVANWVDGTVQSIDTATMTTIGEPINLNAALVNGGYLGSTPQRLALAHPRSVAISNNLDDEENDETLVVTEYFAQQKAALAPNGSNADSARVGLIYRIALGTGPDYKVEIVELKNVDNLGFPDHNNATAGCFPNQLQSITLNGGYAYITSICASPRGPLGVYTPPFKDCPNGDIDCPTGSPGACVAGKCTTNCTTALDCGAYRGVCKSNSTCEQNVADVMTTTAPAVSIVKIQGDPFTTLSLNKEYWTAYGKRVPVPPEDSSLRRLPLLTNDVAFIPNTKQAFFTAGGADAVFRIRFSPSYEGIAYEEIGGSKAFLDLATGDPTKAGEGPIGIAVTHGAATPYAFVANDATRNVAVLDLNQDEIAKTGSLPVVVEASPMPTEPAKRLVAKGKRLFNLGLTRWSLNGQGWGACAECHIDGLTDNVTWFFPRGPRQSLTVDASYSKATSDQRLFGWNASFEEPSDLEASVLRTFFGGVGLIVKGLSITTNDDRIDYAGKGHGGLSGSSQAAATPSTPPAGLEACVLDDWAALTAYLKTVRTPRPPKLDPDMVNKGRVLAENAKCGGCHGGPLWTTAKRFYEPDATGAIGNGLKTRSWAPDVTNFPAALLPAASAQTMRYSGGGAPADFDSLVCALRPVGTFGIAETDVVVVEKRANMTSDAQGNQTDANGYSPPSLLGLSVGAPYFHGGNARTLETVFGSKFAAHHGALSSTFDPTGVDLQNLVAFLLSIDASTPPLSIPSAPSADGGSFCKYP